MWAENPKMITRAASLATMVCRRIVKPWCGPAGVFLLLTATPVSAQQGVLSQSLGGPQPGDTVRVSAGLIGVVVEADSAGLLLSSGYAPYAEMQSLEIWGGTKHQAGRGFKYGLVAGGALGILGGGLACAAVPCDDRVLWASVGGAAGGLLVGVVGAMIGPAVKSDVWTPVLIPGGLSLRWAVGGRPPY